jgi:hypothetical protein
MALTICDGNRLAMSDKIAFASQPTPNVFQ